MAVPSPFPPRSGLAAEIDEARKRLKTLRARPIVAKAYDDEPTDLRALVELAKDMARALDPLFQRIGWLAGVGSLSGASEFAGLVSAGIEDDLLACIAARIERIEDERAGPSQADEDRRWNGTLNARQQGISR